MTPGPLIGLSSPYLLKYIFCGTCLETLELFGCPLHSDVPLCHRLYLSVVHLFEPYKNQEDSSLTKYVLQPKLWHELDFVYAHFGKKHLYTLLFSESSRFTERHTGTCFCDLSQ